MFCNSKLFRKRGPILPPLRVHFGSRSLVTMGLFRLNSWVNRFLRFVRHPYIGVTFTYWIFEFRIGPYLVHIVRIGPIFQSISFPIRSGPWNSFNPWFPSVGLIGPMSCETFLYPFGFFSCPTFGTWVVLGSFCLFLIRTCHRSTFLLLFLVFLP